MSTTRERKAAEEGGGARRPVVVGVGASAGGLPALKTFLDNMPTGHGLAFVLVQHLDPHAESMMARLLTEHSALRVIVARDGARVEADHVYTLPPGRQIGIADGVLRLTERPEGREGHFPIDAFLSALAEDQEENGIAVILTGSGADGSKGVREIKARGGAVFAQDPHEAEQPGMPESAIATGAVDVVAGLAELPARILAYAGQLASGSDRLETLAEVVSLLQERTRMDFSGYKEGTLGRRIQRRMGLRRTAGLADYLGVLREEPEEVERLRKDILIGVTSFFRDPEAFAALEESVLAPLFEGREVSDDVRAWVPGCSTGEEAYSVAMILMERREASGSTVPIHVFATDANEEAIEIARAGVYTDSSLAAVPMERIARFFDPDPAHPGRYVVTPRLRELVTFATQDLVADPPLPKLDVICCRNVLIYMTPDVQTALLSRFHFSLKPTGCLFLGRAESIPEGAPFEPVVRRWRIYRKTSEGAPGARDLMLPSLRGPRPAASAATGSRRASPREQSAAEMAQAWLLATYAPAAVVVDENNRILSFHGAVDAFLNLPRGASVLDLLAMPKEGIRSLVRTALYRATREGEAVRLSGAIPDGAGGWTQVQVRVEPLPSAGSRKPRFIVAFERTGPVVAPVAESAIPAAGDDEYLRQVEDELKATKSDLAETVESSQSHYEELQAANEEVTSMNEELRAANEELMASKEELQALNEEVSSAHEDLQNKFEALRKTKDDLDNILGSTGIATLFVDREFRIVRSTPALARLMNVRPGDAGRPLSDITWRFEDPDLISDARGVLQSLAPSEKEVRTSDGHRYQRRVVPYRTRDDRIDGVLVTFEDVERTRRAQEAVAAARAYAEGIVATIREPLVILDQRARIVSANPAFYERFRLEPRKVEGMSLFDVGGGRWDIRELRDLIERVLPKEREIRDYELTHALDEGKPRKFLINGRRLPDGGEARMLLAIEDAGEAE